MDNKQNHKRINQIVMALSAVLAFVIVFVIAQNIIQGIEQNEKVDVINSYIQFQDDIESIVYNNITMINGYLAYIKSDDTITQEKTSTYLDFLISEHAQFIRNIGIIEDTTIVWNYPYEGNESSIGVDLSLVDDQRDVILQTKERMQPLFQGPVDLVQGGIGFVVRLPIERNNRYWGQVSLVIDGDAFYDAIEKTANDNKIEVALYNINEYPETYFYSTRVLKKENTLTFDLSADLINWKVEVKPIDGWYDNKTAYIIALLLSLLSGLIVVTIIKRQLRIQQAVRYQANHDFLTGLYNRNYLEDYQRHIFDMALLENKTVGIIIMDIDRFKLINDQFGHHVGDDVLKWVANILIKSIGHDDKVFRLGGDEFLIISPIKKGDTALEKIIINIENSLRDEFKTKNVSIPIALSFGQAFYPSDGDNFDMIFKVADRVMYENKKSHRK